MKLLKSKFTCSLWIDLMDNFDSKKMIGNCKKSDIMLYLNKKSSFQDSDDINKNCLLYYVLHPKFGVCWLWTDEKNDITWI